jgi:hypothetical protein
VAGESDPAPLGGRVTAHHRFLLRLHLTHVEALERAVREVEARLGEALAPGTARLEAETRHEATVV